jgi:sec-independent protein translocase protein TatC
VVSQLMLAIPLMILFEGTLVVMRFSERREKAAEAAAEQTDAQAAVSNGDGSVP